MSIIINIYYTGKNGSAKKFAAAMTDAGLVDAIRKEDGNERYDYFFPMDDPETVLLMDGWRDQKALDNHHQSPIMGRISQLREKYDLHMSVERYIPDANAPSSRDEKFVRR